MLRAIERAVWIGDQETATNCLKWYGTEIKTDAGLRRLASVRFELKELLAYEAAHGRHSRLDRTAFEVRYYERVMKRDGFPSRFSSTHPA